MIAIPKKKYTFDEYLALERAEGIRYEFWNGDVVAMAGATKRHNVLVQNTTFSLRAFTRKNGCQVFSENVRMRLPASEKYVYPDVVYTCEPDDLKDDQGIYVTSPCLLIEVLSDSTGADDDHKKRLHYFKIPSLQYYLLVHQDAYKVEVYERSADFWAYRLYEGINTQIPLNNINVTLSMIAIYEGIEVEEEL
ncbi:Uma2 family endonuclease [Fibrella sp. HMF5335]|uniref:Uma2 family endonuclease n=1 Tax=Fibrella rubiginis TaxID=2817060 RepID=A0A939GMI7_9BACT|nr:Uma2 family endonuclease [Fibrella rubiginis]MBO0939531.1 Uma2 family endonuclease [Fibrella rubiginis]